MHEKYESDITRYTKRILIDEWQEKSVDRNTTEIEERHIPIEIEGVIHRGTNSAVTSV